VLPLKLRRGVRPAAAAIAPAYAQEAEAYKATAAHVELSKKMAKRDLATAPAVGDRVAFVIIKVCDSKFVSSWIGFCIPMVLLGTSVRLSSAVIVNDYDSSC
jgi:DNA-binding GntR family transcriptional regulator